MADCRVTVLVENTVGKRGLLAEHGLSLWIEFRGRNILFDTGQSSILFGNARKLGIQLDKADAIVLSHGHYDHTGGLSDVLHATGKIPLYAHPEAFGPKYLRLDEATCRNVGLPNLDQSELSDLAELTPVETPLLITGGLYLTGPIPRRTDFEDPGGAFFKDRECTQPDELPDDQAAYLITPLGSVVILGCAHAGLINTLLRVQELTDQAPIDLVVGGMHLRTAGRKRMDRTIEALRRLKVKRLMPCHCTGFEAMVRFWNEFPGQCETCEVGTVIEMQTG